MQALHVCAVAIVWEGGGWVIEAGVYFSVMVMYRRVCTGAAADGVGVCGSRYTSWLPVALVATRSSAAVTVASCLLTMHPHKHCIVEVHSP